MAVFLEERGAGHTDFVPIFEAAMKCEEDGTVSMGSLFVDCLSAMSTFQVSEHDSRAKRLFCLFCHLA